jgi:IS605 OrfB family transposase
LHEKVARQRQCFQHKLSRRLVGEFGLIAVEKLNVLGLARGLLAKSVHDAAWSQFLFFLRYKVAETGSQVVEVPASGTSQACACCGRIVPKSLSERQHTCVSCGFTTPRDVNAALNILFRGTAREEPLRKGSLLPKGLVMRTSLQAEVLGRRPASYLSSLWAFGTFPTAPHRTGRKSFPLSGSPVSL